MYPYADYTKSVFIERCKKIILITLSSIHSVYSRVISTEKREHSLLAVSIKVTYVTYALSV